MIFVDRTSHHGRWNGQNPEPPPVPRTRKPTLASLSWDATPERLAMAANDNHVLVGANDNGGAVTTRRLTDTPLARLHARRQLAASPGMNQILFDAGMRYYSDWYAAGMCPLGAIDYGKLKVDSTPDTGVNVSEFRLAAVQRHRKARAAMQHSADLVDRVVLDEVDVTSSAHDNVVSLRTAQRRGMAGLLYGLRALAEHYGTCGKEIRCA